MIAGPHRFCTILGGANGSGKSTIYPLLEPVGQFINSDVIARSLNPRSPEKASFPAGRIVLRQLDQACAALESFVYETTLSSQQSLALMSRCKEVGYEVALVFVALDDVELHVKRVAERVTLGGHDIPEDVIRRRYKSAFARLPKAIRIAHRTLLFDNSRLEPELLLLIEFETVTQNRLDPASALHRRIAQAVAEALATDLHSVFRAAR